MKRTVSLLVAMLLLLTALFAAGCAPSRPQGGESVSSTESLPDRSDESSSEEPSEDPSEEIGELGDVDGNDTIDQYDYLLVKRAYFNTYSLSEDAQKRADVDRSGTVDPVDYLYIKRHYFNTYVIPKQ